MIGYLIQIVEDGRNHGSFSVEWAKLFVYIEPAQVYALLYLSLGAHAYCLQQEA
jgi:hypothetical protein